MDTQQINQLAIKVKQAKATLEETELLAIITWRNAETIVRMRRYILMIDRPDAVAIAAEKAFFSIVQWEPEKAGWITYASAIAKNAISDFLAKERRVRRLLSFTGVDCQWLSDSEEALTGQKGTPYDSI